MELGGEISVETVGVRRRVEDVRSKRGRLDGAVAVDAVMALWARVCLALVVAERRKARLLGAVLLAWGIDGNFARFEAAWLSADAVDAEDSGLLVFEAAVDS